MVKIEITGYKKINKSGSTLYYLSAISCETPKDCEGVMTYNGFVSEKYIGDCKLTENTLIGAKGNYYNVKQGNTYKQGISLKN